ncbi:MAG: hypothetical protein H6560_00585 [Lewinellaceae bacterium]|nr:hypothetical protein [Lewinellaceae bacterium]
MKTIKHLCLALITLSMFFACDRETRQDATAIQDEVTVTERSNHNSRPLPFRANFYTDLNLPAILAGEKVCTNPMFEAPNIQTGEGNALHLGRFYTRLEFCGTRVDPPTPEGLVSIYGEVEGYFEAANGDLLYIGLSGIGEIYLSDEPGYDLEFSDDFIIEGGTGRFEGATGLLTSDSYVNLATQRTDHVWTGTITLDH